MSDWQPIETAPNDGRNIITKPKRVQRKRTKGWRMPPNTVSVTRPGRHGNPFQVVRLHGANGPRGEEWIVVDTRTDAWAISATFPNSALAATYAVDCFRREAEPRATEIQRDLKGRNLACYCGLVDQHENYVPCHADVLLSIANNIPMEDVIAAVRMT